MMRTRTESDEYSDGYDDEYDVDRSKERERERKEGREMEKRGGRGSMIGSQELSW